MPCHQPYTAVRILVEWLLRVTWLTGLMWRFFLLAPQDEHPIRRRPLGYTFMMDGTVRAKRIAQSLGFTCSDPSSRRSSSPCTPPTILSRPPTTGWPASLETADELFVQEALEPTLMDVLYIPHDEHFLLSASTGMSGFAVSFAFETNDVARIARIEACFRKLSDSCLRVGGRVYLVKNVRAPAETLAAMFADTLPAFFALKRAVDPHGILRNAFLERNLLEPARTVSVERAALPATVD